MPRHGDAAPARQRPTRAPRWAFWAYDLAQALPERWSWLSAAKLPRVAATLGPRLGPRWTVDGLVGWVMRARDGRPLMEHPDAPLAYLRSLIEDAMVSDVPPPAPSALGDAVRARIEAEDRRVVAVGAAAQRVVQQRTREVLDRRDAAAVRGPARSAAAAAARAAIRAFPGRRPPVAAVPDDCEWPATAQPGSGLPELRGDANPSSDLRGNRG